MDTLNTKASSTRSEFNHLLSHIGQFDAYSVEGRASEIFTAWMSIDVGGQDADLDEYARACVERNERFIKSISISAKLEHVTLDQIMWLLQAIADNRDFIHSVWDDWSQQVRPSIDGSDDDLSEWAAKYSFEGSSLIVGCTDDLEAIRDAVRRQADAVFIQVMRYFAASLQ